MHFSSRLYVLSSSLSYTHTCSRILNRKKRAKSVWLSEELTQACIFASFHQHRRTQLRRASFFLARWNELPCVSYTMRASALRGVECCNCPHTPRPRAPSTVIVSHFRWRNFHPLFRNSLHATRHRRRCRARVCMWKNWKKCNVIVACCTHALFYNNHHWTIVFVVYSTSPTSSLLTVVAFSISEADYPGRRSRWLPRYTCIVSFVR
jgi:hypothetical protein